MDVVSSGIAWPSVDVTVFLWSKKDLRSGAKFGGGGRKENRWVGILSRELGVEYAFILILRLLATSESDAKQTLVLGYNFESTSS